ncbi:hypothetical protein WJX73_003247 [Symbiochloris irregularis]|uniref:Amine oxidase domain-containing protein n=1 Tax=Symbiochloris irregularis TaxID=706552 RepID=A0AAW1NR41_9CHLO
MGKKVVIVGGGFAGLGAARTLASHGQSELIMLEGGQRVGGRANTRDVPGLGRVEFGATYFHGLEGHPLYDAAVDKLMNPIETKEHRWGFLAEGGQLPLSSAEQQQVSSALKAFDKAVESSVAAGKKHRSYTLGEHLQQTLEESCQGLSPEGRDMLLKAWRWHELQLRINTAAPASTAISTEWWADYEELTGPNVPITCGFQAVAEALAEGLDIRYGHTVDLMQWDQSGVKLHCANGATFEADAAIVTVSLGILKARHQQLFQPALPEAKAHAIQALGFGVCEKVFVQAHSYSREKYTGEAGRMWGNSSGEVAHTAASHAPCGLPAPAESQQCACLWLAGAAAEEMDQQSDERVIEGLEAVLRAFPALPQTSGGHRPRGRLFFAGEATTSRHMGTMHGAYLTGQDAARAVIDSLAESKL